MRQTDRPPRPLRRGAPGLRRAPPGRRRRAPSPALEAPVFPIAPDAESGGRVLLPIEALLRLPGHHRVECEPEPQRWRVFQDGRFVGYLTRFASPVRFEVDGGRVSRGRAEPGRPVGGFSGPEEARGR